MMAVAGLLAAAGCAGPQKAARSGTTCAEPVVIYAVEGDYDYVWEDLKMALGDRGLVISTVSHVGEMIDRTGRALGRTCPIFDRANVMSFCSAVTSRNMLEQDPHLVAFCPYEIAVYSLAGAPETIYLSYRRIYWRDPQDRAVVDAVEELLDGIVKDVVASYGGVRVDLTHGSVPPPAVASQHDARQGGTGCSY
jgi:uncharacterized protein (DUF302 family)